jgi:hypothetical protein
LSAITNAPRRGSHKVVPHYDRASEKTIERE